MALTLLLSGAAQAQMDVTRFLGIPVDGSKSEMIRQLKEKGFRSTQYDNEILEGEFNGTNVQLFIATNRNKVRRIMVADANSVDESTIKTRFNRLCRQFENNSKYTCFTYDQTIPEDEKISYEMIVNKKRYEAIFYQRPTTIDTNDLEQFIEQYYKRPVWFMISESRGEYYISMFYDNEYNRANGEDL